MLKSHIPSILHNSNKSQSLGIEPWNSHFPKHPRWFLCIFKFESNPFSNLLSSPLFFLTHSSFIFYPTPRAHVFTNWQVKLYRLNDQVRTYSNIIGLFTRFFFKSWIIKSWFSDFSFSSLYHTKVSFQECYLIFFNQSNTCVWFKKSYSTKAYNEIQQFSYSASFPLFNTMP